MKSLILVLNMALFASLLNLVDGETNAVMKVVATYEGFEKRKVADQYTIVCLVTMGWANLDKAEKVLRNLAGGNNNMKKTFPLDKAGIIVYKKSTDIIKYCKFVVPGGYEGPNVAPTNGKISIVVSKSDRFAFYAKKATDKSLVTITATAAEVLAAITAQKESCMQIADDLIMVETTATNEIYVGLISTSEKLST